MKRQLLALILLCSLLTGCGAKPVTLAPAEDSAPAIAYVPLDDRPDNVERVVYLAESLGYTLLMPEADDYRTRLSGQPLNENGTQSGDRATASFSPWTSCSPADWSIPVPWPPMRSSPSRMGPS